MPKFSIEEHEKRMREILQAQFQAAGMQRLGEAAQRRRAALPRLPSLFKGKK